MRVYVMVGAPGAGKGTQAKLLAERLGLLHLASGDLLREAVEAATPLGRQADEYMKRGALVPDEVVIRLILERLARPDAAEGVILDGFPRTRPQAEALDAALLRRGARVTAALYVDVPREELFRRLSGRWLCRAEGHPYHETERPPAVPGVCDIDGSELYQRDDDRPETISARLEKQLPPMFEVADHYTEAGVLYSIRGEGSIEQVTEALMRAIAQPAR
ncbi:MAG TPA: nucleoside monophosphate kinase [Candidatus Limnocylindrales bacterium]|nr:nucleoside monophosphate kinase [Candidatus Limnocylindrales bacterium]